MLKLKVAQYKNVLIGEVLEQSTDIYEYAEANDFTVYKRVVNKGSINEYAIKICLMDMPGFQFDEDSEDYIIFIRGKEFRHNDLAWSHAFDNEEQATNFRLELAYTVQALNDFFSGMQEKIEKPIAFEVLE